MSGAGLLRADALRIPLRDETVDLMATSPPYYALRSYTDEGEHYDGQLGSEPTPEDFLRGQWAVADEVWRTLKPTGSAWWNYGDKYAGSGGHNNAGISKRNLPGQSAKAANRAVYLPATRRNAPDRYNQASDVRTKSLMGLPWRFVLGLTCPQRYREPIDPSFVCWHEDQPCTVCRYKTLHPQWVLRSEVVWAKPNGLPESVTDRVRRSHEQWFHLVKSARYYAAVDEVRERQQSLDKGRPWSTAVTGSVPTWGTEVGTQGLKGRRTTDQMSALNPLGKLPSSVWTIPSEPLRVPEHIGVDHFAAFPQELVRRIVLGWSPSDGVILDPFGGTGTVAMVARYLGRYGVHIDLSGDYLRLARWRVFESRHATKSEARTNRERQGALW